MEQNAWTAQTKRVISPLMGWSVLPAAVTASSTITCTHVFNQTTTIRQMWRKPPTLYMEANPRMNGKLFTIRISKSTLQLQIALKKHLTSMEFYVSNVLRKNLTSIWNSEIVNNAVKAQSMTKISISACPARATSWGRHPILRRWLPASSLDLIYALLLSIKSLFIF